jgi:hypothetical protein
MEGFKSTVPKPDNEPPRRAFLKTMFAVAGASLLTSDTGIEQPTQNEAGPRSEKVDEFQRAKTRVEASVNNIKNRPFMEKPLRAKAGVEKVRTNADSRSVVLAIEEQGVMKTLHVPEVGELSKRVHDGRGTGVYVHLEDGVKYHITLEDTGVDIGVSNRFVVQRHLGKGVLSESLPVYAVRRARYEKKLVTKEVVENKKRKKVKVDEGGYTEYVTYTPPAEHLTKKEAIGSGKEYVDTVLDAAYATLVQRFPKESKVLPICRDICKRLAVIEHVDPVALRLAEKKEDGDTDKEVETRKKTLYQKMYAEYGLNQNAAFNHLINPLGAGGMMQIMHKTYTDVRRELIGRNVFLPREIPEDANEGRKDPLISAVVALYLCYDNYRGRASFLGSKNPEEIELSLVVMYNGSPNLYGKILNGGDAKKEKGKGKKTAPKNIPPIPYKNPTPLIHKILNHDHGVKLPGSGEPENRNYVRKYLLLKRYEGSLV